MKYFSAFSGIGGFDEGIGRVLSGAECIGYSEVDKYAIKIYEQHFPNRTNYGDIRKIKAEELPDFDIFCGGFPCQDVSIAGKRKGLCGARSGLFFEIIRIIRAKQPQLVFLENVKGLLSSNEGWDFARILVELEGVGYDVEWQVLNSKDFGVPQNRERVFIIGHLRGESWAPIFPIGENINRVDEGTEQTAVNTFTAGGHSGGLHSSMTLVQVGAVGDSQAQRIYSTEGLAKTLSDGGGQGAKTGLYLIGHSRNNEGDTTYHEIEIVGTLKQPSGNQTNYVICDSGQGRKSQLQSETIAPLRANTGASHNNVVNSIRRLTPRECERLQGFPDNWTEGISDTQRYKCLGNAVTVNVIEAIMNKIKEVYFND